MSEPDTELLRSKFIRVYANVPIGLRSDIIAVVDDQPMTWNVVYIEVSTASSMSEKILKYLHRLEII